MILTHGPIPLSVLPQLYHMTFRTILELCSLKGRDLFRPRVRSAYHLSTQACQPSHGNIQPASSNSHYLLINAQASRGGMLASENGPPRTKAGEFLAAPGGQEPLAMVLPALRLDFLPGQYHVGFMQGPLSFRVTCSPNLVQCGVIGIWTVGGLGRPLSRCCFRVCS